jgi:hypothetical protein
MIGALIVTAVGIVLNSMQPAPPAWLNYQQDTFLGIIWRWSYTGSHLSESSITPFCPQCETRMRGEQQGIKT